MALGYPWQTVARPRHDPLAVLDRHRASDADRKAADADARRTVVLLGPADAGHRGDPDAGADPACWPSPGPCADRSSIRARWAKRRGEGAAVVAEKAISYMASLPGWGVTLVHPGGGGADHPGRGLRLAPIFRFIHMARLREMYTAFALLIVVRHRLPDDPGRPLPRARHLPCRRRAGQLANSGTSSKATSSRSRACCWACSSSPSARASTSPVLFGDPIELIAADAGLMMLMKGAIL